MLPPVLKNTQKRFFFQIGFFFLRGVIKEFEQKLELGHIRQSYSEERWLEQKQIKFLLQKIFEKF